MHYYAVVVAVVLAVNLLPAFAPPTWSLLVLFKLNWHLNAVALVLFGALAAGTGRYLLARASFRLRNYLSERRRANLEAAGDYLSGHRAGPIVGLGLFALSPLPSAQLFEAAGVLALSLVPLTLAFFAGRLVSYTLYLGAADIAQRSYGDVITSALTSPIGIGLQVLMLIGIALLTQVDWARLTKRRHDPDGGAAG